jgi:tetratricopeptide (TPR) repeat protein
VLDSNRTTHGSHGVGHAAGDSRLKAKGRRGSDSNLRDRVGTMPENRRTDMVYVNAVRQFESASVHFHKQQYTKAKEIFEKLLAAPYPEITDRARLHLRLCEQKLEAAAPPLKRVDHYLLGVAELNARNVEVAIHHLTKADKSAPNREHIRYALAAAHAVQGNADAALEHLKAAVRLRPQNGYQARHDQDFESLAEHPVFRSLVRGDVARAASTAV